MRAIQLNEDRSLTPVELEPEPLGPGDIRLQVRFCGICGSDLHIRNEAPIPPVGMILGHEFSGHVIEVGAEVRGFGPGDRVCVNPFDTCGECAMCARGARHLCTNLNGIGLGRKRGGYAEQVVVNAATAHLLPAAVSDEAGALVEPLAVGVHGVALSGVERHTPTVVLGAGPIGIMTALALRARGFERIVVVELVEHRREVAADLGFTVTDGGEGQAHTLELLGGQAPPAVFDCTGHRVGLGTAIGLVEQQGIVMEVGIPFEPAPVSVLALSGKEVTVKGVLAYTDEDFAEAIDHLAHGRIDAGKIITTIAPLEETQEWFEDLTSGHTRQVKVLLAP